MAIWEEYLIAAFWYNLQILPDAVIAGTILLAVLLANQSLLFLAIFGVLAQYLTGAVGRILMKMAPDHARPTIEPLDGCRGGFLGKGWASLLNPNPDHIWYPLAPSRYMALLGFFAGVGAAIQQLYMDEIKAGIIGRNTLVATSITSILIIILAGWFRYFVGCDTIASIFGGLIVGLILGYFGYLALGYGSYRRLTNIWGIPLLRDRINNGSALYICPGSSSF